MLFKSTALLLLVHCANAIDCQTAWVSLSYDVNGACSTTGLTSDDLNADVCPEACQNLLDIVIGSCSDGDKYDESDELFDTYGFAYSESLLYYKHFQTETAEFSPKWKSCNYGYTPTPCQTAWVPLSYDVDGACSTTGLTSDDLNADVCPEACQNLLDNVIDNCSDGDKYDESDEAWAYGFAYSTPLLYHEYFQTAFSPKWKSCSYGYTPTPCDIAYGTLSVVTFGDAFGYGPDPQIIDPSICQNTANEVCSEDCKLLIDNVAQSCLIGATFAPNSGYFGLTNKQTSWEYPKSMEWLGYNPNVFEIIGTLSFDCWDFYEAQVSANEVEIGTKEDESSSGFLHLLNAPVAFVSFAVTVFNLQA
jgi:hypothetical protein